MRLLTKIVILLLPIQLFSVDSFFITQPCGWHETEYKDFSHELYDSREQVLSYFEILNDGFLIQKKDFILQATDESYQLVNERYTVILKKSDFPLQIIEDKSFYQFKISNYSLLFLLSNNNLEYSLRNNTINFPKNESDIAYAPNDLRIIKEPGSSTYDDIIVNDFRTEIYLFGPILLHETIKTEYKMGDIIGTFQTSLWLSFENFEDDLVLFPIIIYDNNIEPLKL